MDILKKFSPALSEKLLKKEKKKKKKNCPLRKSAAFLDSLRKRSSFMIGCSQISTVTVL
jgi:hypothetical protein